MTALWPKDLTDTLEDFSRMLWAPGDLIEIRALKGRDEARSFFWRAETLAGPDHVETLQRMNAEDWNIFAGTLPRQAAGGKTDQDTLPGWCAWVDFDDCGIPQAEERIEGAELMAPSVLIDSGHGSHVYWSFTDRVPPGEISGLVGDLAALLSADPSVKNPSRVMRIPGFTNHKPPAAACRAYRISTERYSFSELRSIVPRRTEPQAIPTAPISGDRAGTLARAKKYIGTIQGSGPGGRRNAAYKAAAALTKDFMLCETEALPLLIEWDAERNHPSVSHDYGEEELVTILKNAGKYGKAVLGRALASFSTGDEIPLPNESGSGGLFEAFEAEGRGGRETLSMPWRRLSELSGLLRPGTFALIGGPSGYGKSHLLLELLLRAHLDGQAVSLLPLEGRKMDVERRALAVLARTWEPISDSQDGAEQRKELLRRHEKTLAGFMDHVCENPLLPQAGAQAAPEVHADAVLNWITRAAKVSRIVAIDPLAQLSFGVLQEWQGQSLFARRLAALAANSRSTILIAAHTVKRPGQHRGQPLSTEDLQGSIQLSRLSDAVILIDRHDKISNHVHRCSGIEEVEHDRTISIGKARHASGGGARLAFRLEDARFEELGVIAPRRKKQAL